jgi:translation initiation factor IF-1
MVKNVTGGSSHKKFGRKFSTNSSSKAGTKLRISEDEGEIYCIVTKNLGNNMFQCCSTRGVTYLGHIRGKFAGRGRRDNTIGPGVWVLVGLREWDNSSSAIKNGKAKLKQCDLLEVYTDLDVHRLKDTVDETWNVLIENDPTRINKDADLETDVVFQTEKDMERTKLVEEMNSGTAKKITLVSEEKIVEEEFNIKYKISFFSILFFNYHFLCYI